MPDSVGSATGACNAPDTNTSVSAANENNVVDKTVDREVSTNVVDVPTVEEKTVVDQAAMVKASLTANEEIVARYSGIQGVRGNSNVTPAFLNGVEAMAARLGADPAHILATMSFETGGTFDPAKTNSIGATGLIQFLPSTASGLGTSTAALRNMSPTEQLVYVEKYFEPFKGNLNTLEKVYTAVLSGSPKSNPNSVLFRAGTRAYDQNPLDWNGDGVITAAEATTPVAARMYGGVRAVQQRLVASGVVPAAQAERFPDGIWGRNTAAALATFQAANGLPATGNLDAVTAARLAGIETTPVDPAPAVLSRGATGQAVEALQDSLIRFGEMSEADKATGPGIFGPKTEAALKRLQTNLGLSPTGQFDGATQNAMNAVFGGVEIGERSPIVAALQNKLVELGFMTASQMATGPGIFGSRTDAALKAFQRTNGIFVDGVFGPQTYRTMFPATPGGSGTNGTTTPNTTLYDANSNVVITRTLASRLDNIASEYTRLTGTRLFVTSGYRTPERQASAMANLINTRGRTYVRNLYANKTAVGEIISAFDRGGIAEMTRTIEAQTTRGVHISDHLRSGAFDIRLGVDETVLRRIVQNAGGQYLREPDHIHVEF
ncbi:MAG: peptidoglycan-binding protein [Pyrinomonadaceae bacterium]